MQRVISLEGGRNFRDLGGYAAGENQRVRWGRLYRSGTLSNVTPDGHAALRARGVRVLCDFRTRREREREAVDWNGDGRALLAWDYDPKLVSVRALLVSPVVGFVCAGALLLLMKVLIRYKPLYEPPPDSTSPPPWPIRALLVLT